LHKVRKHEYVLGKNGIW